MIVTDVQNTGKTTQALIPEAEVVPENAPQPEEASARSVVQELDVLLLHAAGKSVSTDVATRVRETATGTTISSTSTRTPAK